MAENILKIIDAFYAAKRVHHYYWMHTDGDDHEQQQVSVDNIQWIIATLCNVQIESLELEFEGRFHRAFVERFDDGARNVIYVMKSEPGNWQRISTVKELCHILIDTPGDFQPDPCRTIEGIKDDGIIPFHEHSMNEVDSEALAEMIAMELVYPLEFRRADREAINDGATLSELSDKRKVPEKYIALGTSKAHYDACMEVWKRLPPVEPPNLNEHISN